MLRARCSFVKYFDAQYTRERGMGDGETGLRVRGEAAYKFLTINRDLETLQRLRELKTVIY